MRIVFNIDPIKLDGSNIPLDIRIYTPYTELNPYFIFKNSYEFPGPIIFGTANLSDPDNLYRKTYYSDYGFEPICFRGKTQEFEFSDYIEFGREALLCEFLSSFSPGIRCRHPEYCRIWIPSKFGSDNYLDFIHVFNEILKDFREAWKKAIDKALENEEIGFTYRLITILD